MKRKPLKLDLPYLSAERSRHGKDRLYVRRFGRRILIAETPGTAAFMLAYAEAVQALSARAPVKTAPTKPAHPYGSLGWLGAKYFASAEFVRLSTNSQATRRAILEACFAEPHTDTDREPMGNCPLVHFSAAKVRRLRDLKAETPGAANNRKKYLSSMFGWAVESGLATANPVRDVRRIQYASEGFHSWEIDEVLKFEERHPIGTKARLALAFLLFTGVRRSDLVTLGKQHVKDGWLRFVPQKTRYKRKRISEKPILPVLAGIIAASPCGDLTFLVTKFGQAFTANGFGNWFRDRCNEAGLPQCSAHGLRKAGATLAAENGATVHQLCAIYDWETVKQAEAYTRTADRRRLAGEAMPMLVRKPK